MKGILFKPDMIKAIMEGRKTQTRRLDGLKEINKEPKHWELAIGKGSFTSAEFTFFSLMDGHCLYPKHRYHPGEVVYVKEPHYAYGYWTTKSDGWEFIRLGNKITFLNEPKPDNILTGHSYKSGHYLRSPLFHEAKYARTHLKILSVEPQRLLNITPEDCVAEGHPFGQPEWNESPSDKQLEIAKRMRIGWYITLWDSINPDYPSSLNPWDWKISFEKVQP